jgi:hypothetical protein
VKEQAGKAKEDGRRKKENMAQTLGIPSSPFLGEKGRLRQLSWWRGRRESQEWKGLWASSKNPNTRRGKERAINGIKR